MMTLREKADRIHEIGVELSSISYDMGDLETRDAIERTGQNCLIISYSMKIDIEVDMKSIIKSVEDL